MNSKNCSTAALAVGAILVIGTLVAILPTGDADARSKGDYKKFYDDWKAKKKSSSGSKTIVKDNTVPGGDGGTGGSGAQGGPGQRW